MPETLQNNESVSEETPLNQIDQDVQELKENVEQTKEKSFTFKPIAVDLIGSEIKNGKDWAENLTTTVEFAGGGKNLSIYGYTRKDWNKFAKGLNEGIEIFANENLNLKENLDLNGKQFYWGKGSGRIMIGPQIHAGTRIGNVEVGASLGGYGTYDVIPSSKDRISGSSVVNINFSVKQSNGNTWNGNAFLNISGIKDFNIGNYGAYGEASLTTPNFLDPGVVGQLCGILIARYGGTLQKLSLQCFGVGFQLKFKSY